MDEELLTLLRLTHLPGIGPVRLRRLLQRCGAATALWQQPWDDVADLLPATLRDGWQRRAQHEGWRSDLELVQRHGVNLIPYYDRRYPPGLLDIGDPPILLYVQGALAPADRRAVAIIGTRQATAYGMAMAQQFASTLAQCGVTVLSGLARGIDTAAHSAALAQGRTLAVVGSGLARPYPPENGPLAQAIAQRGAVLSELPMATPPDRQTFPQRNRLLSAMATLVLLVEAPLKSGAMLTMALAHGQQRPCLALPGRLDYPSFTGNHHLIKEGKATLATAPEQLLAYFDGLFPLLQGDAAPPPAPPLSAEELLLWQRLPADELSIDEISVATTLPVAKLAVLLMGLVMKKAVAQRPGQRYQKRTGQ